MFDIHLTPELLQAVAHGNLPLELFHRMMLAHAVQVSPRAGRELDRWRFEGPGAEVVGQIEGGRYGDVFDRLGPRLGIALDTAAKQRSQAELELAELRRLPAAERPRRVRRSRRRFRSPALVDEALAAGWSELLTSPESALHWADVAFWIAVRLDTDPRLKDALGTEFRLRAQALRATAAHFDEPATALVELEAIRAEARSSFGHWPELEAEVAVLEGLVLRRGGLENRAAQCLHRALDLLEELEPEDRPWLTLAEHELAALGPCRGALAGHVQPWQALSTHARRLKPAP